MLKESHQLILTLKICNNCDCGIKTKIETSEWNRIEMLEIAPCI